jgi:hypothetical protein
MPGDGSLLGHNRGRKPSVRNRVKREKSRMTKHNATFSFQALAMLDVVKCCGKHDFKHHMGAQQDTMVVNQYQSPFSS